MQVTIMKDIMYTKLKIFKGRIKSVFSNTNDNFDVFIEVRENKLIEILNSELRR